MTQIVIVLLVVLLLTVGILFICNQVEKEYKNMQDFERSQEYQKDGGMNCLKPS